MSDDDLAMTRKSRFYPPRFPVPKYHVPVRIPTADPLAVRREAHLAGIPCDRVPGKALLSILPIVVSAEDENLVVQ